MCYNYNIHLVGTGDLLMKKLLKYVLNFAKDYIIYTFGLFLLNENKPMGHILIDGAFITCLFKIVEFIIAIIKKHRKSKNKMNEDSEKSNENDDVMFMWISGICFILLIVIFCLKKLL